MSYSESKERYLESLRATHNDVGNMVFWNKPSGYMGEDVVVWDVLLLAIVGEWAMVEVIDGANKRTPEICKTKDLRRE